MLDFNPFQLMVIGAIAVLLFGERLPDVARSAGKQIMELKKGIRGIQDQITSAVNSTVTPSSSPGSGGEVRFEDVEDHEEATAPKFEPPPGQPAAPSSAAAASAEPSERIAGGGA